MEDSRLNQTPNALDDLCRLVQTLRGDNGCPWDKKQTPESVSIYLIEELYELVEAIDSGSSEQICEELGDVLFHIVFITRMFEEIGKFDLSLVARSITEKMIRRHPHVFGEQEVSTSAEVTQNWHKIKLTEKKDGNSQSLFESLPAKLPALIRAYRISDRAAKSGFEWTETAENETNPESMAGELLTALKNKDRSFASRKFGDLLFALINQARLAEIHPEGALTGSVKKFEARFRKMEEIVAESNREFDKVSREEKKRIWLKVQKLIP
jgi:tetrapyrrole methylase family protein/MazG family protein